MASEQELSPLQLIVLKCLARQTEDKPNREIANACGFGKQAVATTIWRLRQMGYADKPGPERYCITKQGRKVIDGE